MRLSGDTIPIDLGDNDYLLVCYDESTLLKRLTQYPYWQLGVVMIFVVVAIFALLSSKRAEQNKVWVGLSKETAHQLGTPISSLMAWTEMLKESYPDDELIPEMEQDVRRFVQHMTPLTFPDHHYYTKRDAETISQALKDLPQPHIIITTEKDATRLLHLKGLSEEVKENTYVLPIGISIMRNEKDKFDKTILDYVQENKRNS